MDLTSRLRKSRRLLYTLGDCWWIQSHPCLCFKLAQWQGQSRWLEMDFCKFHDPRPILTIHFFFPAHRRAYYSVPRNRDLVFHSRLS